MKQFLGSMLAILSFAGLVLAIPGDLDLTFNGTGKAMTSFGANVSTGRAIASQADGKIVVAGEFALVVNTVIAVARYNADGSLDTTFDLDGMLTTAISNNILLCDAVAIQTDGKIVVGGRNANQAEYFIIRYNSDGSLDATFGAGGIAQTPVPGASGGGVKGSLAIQTDGKIVVAGAVFSNPSFDFFVARYNTNGTLDTSFDIDGIVTTSISVNWDYASAVAIQADGKIVVAGQSRNDVDGWDEFSVVRYNTDGSLDTSFDGDGKLTTSIGVVSARSGSDAANGVAIQSDQKLVVAGFTGFSNVIGTSNDFAVVRYNIDGSLDTTFDADGKVWTTFGTNTTDQANAVIIQTDGKIIAAGRTTLNNNDFAFVRYNPDGSLDNSLAFMDAPNVFGTNGKVMVDFAGGNDVAFGVALAAPNRILAAGTSGTNFGTAALQAQVPTAANVSISGRVMTSKGFGLNGSVVSITGSQGITRSVRTNSFGYYRFDYVEAGQTVIIGVSSKQYLFTERIVSLTNELTGIDFTAL